MDKGDEGAIAIHTMIDGTEKFSEEEWDAIRVGMVCTDPATFGDWKANIEKLCSYTNDCSYEQKQNMYRFFQDMDRASK